MTGWPALTNSAPSAPPSRPAPMVAILSGAAPDAVCAGAVWAKAANGPAASARMATTPPAKWRTSRRVGWIGGAIGMFGSSNWLVLMIIGGGGPPRGSRSRKSGGRGAHMLGAKAEPDQPRGDARQERHMIEQPHQPGRLDRLVRAQHRVEDPLLDRHLQRLGQPRRQGAAALDGFQVRIPQRAVAQPPGQDIGGGDGVLDREIDAAPADRRHRMGAVADAQQPWAPPARQPVDRDRQQLDVVPVAQFGDPVRQKRGDPDDVVAEAGEPALADRVEPALADHERALPVIAAVEHYQHATVVEPAGALPWVARAFRDPHPQYIDRRAEVDDVESGAVADDRMAAIRADHAIAE